MSEDLLEILSGMGAVRSALRSRRFEPRALRYHPAMISAAHVIIYSKDAEADRAFFRDVLKYPSVDAGHGWLIFALPPAEIAVHPSDENDVHELYFMCNDVHAFIADMNARHVECSRIDEQRWGSITRVTLPGGGKVGVYQPKHPSPLRSDPAGVGAPRSRA
jgi:catechol 2,3-dioxygenase-like lactoylglutathione lyase family enzyme